jgi:hypothetical protein
VRSWQDDLRGWAQYGFALAAAGSVVAAVAITFQGLGHSRAVLAVTVAGLLGAVASLVGTQLIAKRSIDAYQKEAETSRRAGMSSTADPEFLNTQVIPALMDQGLDRARDFFISLITDLDLPKEERERQLDFIKATYDDDGLSKREKIERLARRYEALRN